VQLHGDPGSFGSCPFEMRVDVIDGNVQHAGAAPDVERRVDVVAALRLGGGSADHHHAVADLEPGQHRVAPGALAHPRLPALPKAEGAAEELQRGGLVAISETRVE